MSGEQAASAQAGTAAADATAAAAATQAAATQTAMGAATAEAPPEWAKDFPAETLTVIKAKGYKTPADLAQAYISAEKMIGVDKIAAPKDGKWSPEALKALGVPDKPEGYQITRPQMPEGVTYDEGFEKAMLPIVHAQGLPPATVNALIEAVSAYRIQEMRNTAIAQADAQKVAMDGLHAEFGQKTQAIVNQAGRAALAIEKMGVKGLVDRLNETRTGDDPVMIRAFAKIGEMMGEDVLKSGVPAGGAISPDQAKTAIAALQNEAAYIKKDHPGHKAAVEQMARLYSAAYPEPRA